MIYSLKALTPGVITSQLQTPIWGCFLTMPKCTLYDSGKLANKCTTMSSSDTVSLVMDSPSKGPYVFIDRPPLALRHRAIIGVAFYLTNS